jgi:hypothetical protein
MKFLTIVFAVWVAALGCDRSQDLGNGANGGCRPGQNSCSGKCTDPYSDPAHCGSCQVACGAGQVCALGQCMGSCPQDPAGGTYTSCDGACVNLARSLSNCGRCGNVCPDQQFCVAGVCQTCAQTNPQAPDYCVLDEGNGPYEGCVSLMSAPDHCGQCDRKCAGTQASCLAGVCK